MDGVVHGGQAVDCRAGVHLGGKVGRSHVVGQQLQQRKLVEYRGPDHGADGHGVVLAHSGIGALVQE